MLISRLSGWGDLSKPHTYNTAPSYIRYSPMAYGSSSISITVATNYQSGDLLILLLYGKSSLPAVPSGWTLFDSWRNFAICYKIAAASETSVTVINDGTFMCGMMLCFRGVDVDNPFNAVSKGSKNGTSFSAPMITTTVPNCLVGVSVGFIDWGSNDSSNYSGWSNSSLQSITEVYDTHRTEGAGLAFAYGIKLSAGDSSATTATTDSNINDSTIITFALTPAE